MCLSGAEALSEMTVPLLLSVLTSLTTLTEIYVALANPLECLWRYPLPNYPFVEEQPRRPRAKPKVRVHSDPEPD